MAAPSSKKKNRHESTQRNRSRRRARVTLIASLVAIALALGGWYAWRETNRSGRSVESMGRAHVPQGVPDPRYNSSPPTSGPHAGTTGWGEHFSEIPHVNQVHNLEHGGVLVQYNCEHDTLRARCDQVRQELRAIVREARDQIDSKIILAPYAGMDQPIALTAWTRVQYFAVPNREAILAFVRSNINRAPERVD
jgi:hypothetical protein